MAGDSLAIDPSTLIGQYYRGTIVRLRRGNQGGFVRSAATGRVVPFELAHLRLVGVERFEELREGMTVGYDVSRTERGPLVSVLWVPDPGGKPLSERQRGAEENEAAHHLADENSQDRDVE
jgi:cold shock CspA family protein